MRIPSVSIYTIEMSGRCLIRKLFRKANCVFCVGIIYSLYRLERLYSQITKRHDVVRACRHTNLKRVCSILENSLCRETQVADLNTALKETTTETNETVQELKTELADVKKQLGDQQKVIREMYRHKSDNSRVG